MERGWRREGKAIFDSLRGQIAVVARRVLVPSSRLFLYIFILYIYIFFFVLFLQLRNLEPRCSEARSFYFFFFPRARFECRLAREEARRKERRFQKVYRLAYLSPGELVNRLMYIWPCVDNV